MSDKSQVSEMDKWIDAIGEAQREVETAKLAARIMSEKFLSWVRDENNSQREMEQENVIVSGDYGGLLTKGNRLKPTGDRLIRLSDLEQLFKAHKDQK